MTFISLLIHTNHNRCDQSEIDIGCNFDAVCLASREELSCVEEITSDLGDGLTIPL